MPLINCPECQKDISNKAKNCPNCGFPLKQSLFSKLKKATAKSLQKQKSRAKKIFNTIKLPLIVILSIALSLGIVLLFLWLLEVAVETNPIAALVLIVIGGNIGGYFFLFRTARTSIKIFLILFFVFEIFGIVSMSSIFI